MPSKVRQSIEIVEPLSGTVSMVGPAWATRYRFNRGRENTATAAIASKSLVIMKEIARHRVRGRPGLIIGYILINEIESEFPSNCLDL